MKKISLLLFVALLIVMSSPSWAAGCYSAAEAEAEQGIRIHSELMVIGLNCQHMTPRGWTNFYQQYREITNRHAGLFSGYEQTMVNYFKRNGSGGGAERKVHDMRTSFSNKVSADIARMRPDVFCATYSPRIPQTAKMSRGEIQQWAASTATGQRLSKPLCR
ncbi:MAG: hypothetical protein MRY79_00145 [Alphaproteobacteria bacterium]|nr:hypothetical protein [Alphaproteobacteria bacterium]